LSDGERKTLADIGQKLGKQALEEIATIVKPDTILAWHRKLSAQKLDGSHQRKAPGRSHGAPPAPVSVQPVKTGITPQRAIPSHRQEGETGPLRHAGRLHERR